MRLVSLGCLVLGLCSSAAMAQGGAPAPAHTGLRAEALLGYDSMAGLEASDAHANAGDDDAGLLYGAGLGYDFAAGNAVLGLEAEFTDTSAQKCHDGAVAGRKACVGFGRDLYVGGRAGFSTGPMLLYAKAGYTNVERETMWTSGTVGTEAYTDEKLGGYRLGLGGEYSVSSRAYLKTEYRYSHYDQGDDVIGGTAASPVTLKGDSLNRHQLVAGFGFRF